MSDTANKKYTDEERYRRGIDRILKSDQYTEEYKKVLMEQIGNNYNVPVQSPTEDVDFDLLKNGGIVITASANTGSLVTVTDKPAAVSGYLEKPTYLEDELQKAVDVDVDELIKLPPKQKPLTVPKPVHDALQVQYDAAVNDLEDLRDQLNFKISELETANQNINLLNQTVDSEKLLRSAANNETQSANNRYISVLKDFQNALQKGIQEAIERVSLTAQVRGLQAQKEVLQQQLEQMAVIVKNLQQNVEQAADALTAATFLGGKPGTFGKAAGSGWKIPDSNVDASTDTGNTPLYYKKYPGSWVNGNVVEFYNLSDEPLIFTFSYEKVIRKEVKGDKTGNPFMIGPTRITIPARIEGTPGKSVETFNKQYVWSATRKAKILNRSSYAEDKITVTVSNGETFEIGATYTLR